MSKKLLIPALAFLTDSALSFYTYLVSTNYDEYQKYFKNAINDPDFQLELYKVFVQTLTFVIMLFLFFHLIVYIFFYRGNKFARKYVKFYLILAIASLALGVLFSFNIYLLLAAASYVFCFSKLKTQA